MKKRKFSKLTAIFLSFCLVMACISPVFAEELMLGLRHWLIGIVCYVLFTLLLNYVAFNFMQIILPTGVLFG